MQTPKERMQEYVREQCGLKRLERGAVVKYPNGSPMIVNHLKSRTDGKHELYASSVRDGEPLELLGLKTKDVEELIVIGKEPSLHHYLAVLGNGVNDDTLIVYPRKRGLPVAFSLTTGQPATETDWEIMSNILGV